MFPGYLYFLQVKHLTDENVQLKARIADLERLVDPQVLNALNKHRTQNVSSIKLYSYQNSLYIL